MMSFVNMSLTFFFRDIVFEDIIILFTQGLSVIVSKD